MMQRVEAGDTTTVPVPDHRELRTGTLMSVIRQSGLPGSSLNELRLRFIQMLHVGFECRSPAQKPTGHFLFIFTPAPTTRRRFCLSSCAAHRTGQNQELFWSGSSWRCNRPRIPVTGMFTSPCGRRGGSPCPTLGTRRWRSLAQSQIGLSGMPGASVLECIPNTPHDQPLHGCQFAKHQLCFSHTSSQPWR